MVVEYISIQGRKVLIADVTKFKKKYTKCN